MGLNTSLLGGSRGAAAPDVLKLALLGPPIVQWAGRTVAFRTRKEFGLLAYLAVTQKPQPRALLASLLWPDHEDASSRTLLRRTLAFLRQHLSESGNTADVDSQLLRSERDRLGRDVVWLARDGSPSIWLDTDFLEEVTTALSVSGSNGDTYAALTAAVAAYRGPFLEGISFDDAPELDDWIAKQRVHWEARIEEILASLAKLEFGRGAFADAMATARRWLEVNPVSEPAYRALMKSHAAQGDPVKALGVYAECQGVLQAKMEMDPTPETVALAERIRHESLSLAVNDGRLADTRRPESTHGTLGVAGRFELPLVGRSAEFESIVTAFQMTRSGQTRIVLLEGEAGIGKTRLAEEFLRWATLQGADVLRGRAFEAGSSFPYQLLVDALRPRLARENAPEDLVNDVWLAELVRLFPELHERYPDLPPPGRSALNESTGRGRLFEAVAQLTMSLATGSQPAPLVLFFDDIQWGDAASRDVLQYCIRRHREADAPLLVLLTFRSDALETAPDLGIWLNRVPREVPVARLSLGLLSPTETEHALSMLIAGPGIEGSAPAGASGDDKHQSSSLAGWKEADDVARRQVRRLGEWLHVRTEGQPFYLVEMIRDLVDRGKLVHQDWGDGSPATWFPDTGMDGAEASPIVPGTVRDMIRGQLDGLSPTAVSMLLALAVLGVDGTFEQVCQVSQMSQRNGLVALDQLVRRHLIVEGTVEQNRSGMNPSEASRLRFVHDLVREVVYAEAGEIRLRVFHRRAYTVREVSGAPAAELARHALAAGLVGPAFEYSLAAGDAALDVFAVRDAIAHYERARELLVEPEVHMPESARELAEHLYTQLGRAYEWTGAWDQARAAYEALRGQAKGRVAPTVEGGILTRLALIAWEQSSDTKSGLELGREALRVLEPTGDTRLLAEAHWAVAQVCVTAGELLDARTHVLQAQELARAENLEEVLAGCFWIRGMTSIRFGDWDDAIEALQEGARRYSLLAGSSPSLEGTGAVSSAEKDEPHLGLPFSWLGPSTARALKANVANCIAYRALGEICRGYPRLGADLGRTALELARDAWDDTAEGFSRWALSYALVELGRYEEAVSGARLGIHAEPVAKGPGAMLQVLRSLAYSLIAICDLKTAQDVLAKARELVELRGLAERTVYPQSYLCAALALAGDWRGAVTAATRAIHIRDSLDARILPFDFARYYETEALLRAGDVSGARNDLMAFGERLREGREDQRYRLVYCRMAAQIARFTGQTEEAGSCLNRALQLATDLSLPGEEWQAWAALASVYRAAGDPESERNVRDRASAGIKALGQGIKNPRARENFLTVAFRRMEELGV